MSDQLNHNNNIDNDHDDDQPLTLSFDNFASTESSSISSLTDNNEDDGDIVGVLEALLEIHQLEARENTFKAYERDHVLINKAIALNEQMQREVTWQINFIDDQLQSNSKTMTEARYSANAENRFGQRLYLHRPYDTKVDYFDKTELIQQPGKEKADDGSNEETEVDEEGDHFVEEDQEDDLVDSERKLPSKAWSRKERQKLMAGILSEARRSIAYDHLKNGEGWRVWDVEKIDHSELENYPVSRLDWNRISSIHVHSRTANQCLMQWTTQEHPIINKKPWSKQESEQLSKLVDEIGNNEWEKIATELGTNRTISQCFSHYMAEKNLKSARSLKWTPEEDAKLALAIKVFGNCNWQHIASMMNGWTGGQCLQRWTKTLNPTINRARWTPEESEALTRAVKLYGEGNWSKIQRLLPGRTDMQCRERFVNINQPTVNRKKMTEEEKNHLVALVKEVGPKWSYISGFFPGRTDNYVFRQYHSQVNKAEREAEKEQNKETRQAEKKKEGEQGPDAAPKKKRVTRKRKTIATKKKPAGEQNKKTAKKRKAVESDIEDFLVDSEDEDDDDDSDDVTNEANIPTSNSSSTTKRRKKSKTSDTDADNISEDDYRPPPVHLPKDGKGILTRRQRQQLELLQQQQAKSSS